MMKVDKNDVDSMLGKLNVDVKVVFDNDFRSKYDTLSKGEREAVKLLINYLYHKECLKELVKMYDDAEIKLHKVVYNVYFKNDKQYNDLYYLPPDYTRFIFSYLYDYMDNTSHYDIDDFVRFVLKESVPQPEEVDFIFLKEVINTVGFGFLNRIYLIRKTITSVNILIDDIREKIYNTRWNMLCERNDFVESYIKRLLPHFKKLAKQLSRCYTVSYYSIDVDYKISDDNVIEDSYDDNVIEGAGENYAFKHIVQSVSNIVYFILLTSKLRVKYLKSTKILCSHCQTGVMLE